jgi:hypothetical protein
MGPNHKRHLGPELHPEYVNMGGVDCLSSMLLVDALRQSQPCASRLSGQTTTFHDDSFILAAEESEKQKSCIRRRCHQ